MNAVQDRTVLVTGAGGYIGKSVLCALRSYGVTAIGLDRAGVEMPNASIILSGDIINSSKDVLASIADIKPNACVHLAWRNGFDHNSASHMADLSGHYGFLSGLVDCGVSRIAVMGSMHEIGYWEGAINADTPCNPGSMYGIAKDALRRAFMLYSEGKSVEAVWMRGYYIYGNDLASSSIFGKIAQAAKRGDKTFPFTSGKNLYDFIHIDELGRQIAACALAEGETGIINCCTGEPESLASRVESYISENGYDISLDYGAFPDRPYDSPGVWGDASRIKRIMKNATDWEQR